MVCRIHRPDRNKASPIRPDYATRGRLPEAVVSPPLSGMATIRLVARVNTAPSGWMFLATGLLITIAAVVGESGR